MPVTSMHGAPRSVPTRGSSSARRSAIPGLEVLDIPRVAALAHDHGLPLLVDSTFTTPYLVRPFEHGADLVFHSATKFLSGHGVVIGGVVVDSGQFRWDAGEARGKFPTLTEPYHGFHDMVFTEESTTGAFLLRARREGIRDFGACMSPFVAFQVLQGMETLPLRMAKHVANARQIATFLHTHPFVQSVGYPDLPDHPDHELAQRLLPRGSGAVFSFAIKGNRAQGRKLIESLHALLAPGQCGRCQVARDPSRVHHALPHVGRGSRRARASARARSACRSGSRIPRTSSRTCRARCMRRAR